MRIHLLQSNLNDFMDRQEISGGPDLVCTPDLLNPGEELFSLPLILKTRFYFLTLVMKQKYRDFK